jgi:DNA-binding CsgD family transcriptional regulator
VSTSTPLRVLEAAYSFVPDERAWLQGIVEALRPYDLGEGLAAYCSDLGPTLAARTIVNETGIESATIHAMVTQLPPAFYRRLHIPMPLVSSFDFFPQALRDVCLEESSWPHVVGVPTPDASWAICGGDADVETALVVFHCQPGDAHAARDKHALDCLAAHLGSALRLRSLLRDAPSGDHPSVEAVFASDGRLLDARGAAQDSEERAPLLDAVRRSERAKLRSATPEERLDLWTALVEGRWSILENVERDGKRTLLACRNDPRTTPMRSLTAREQAVVAYAACGHSFKYIAYELGIALPTAAASLETALRKLGLTSRTELIRLLAGR